jgi:hypothetical protein
MQIKKVQESQTFHPKVKVRTFNIQKQKPSTSKNKKVRTFNIQE